MIKALEFNIKKLDKFHYVPILGFQGRAKQSSILGGCSTVIIFLIITYVFFYEMHLVFNYYDYYHRQIETAADMNEIGLVSMDEMGTTPFYSVHYDGHRLKRTDDKHCKETQGDCFKLTQKYLKIIWNNARQTEDDWEDNFYSAHICTADEISKGLYDTK